MKVYLKKALLILGILGIIFLLVKWMFISSERMPGETLTDAVLARDTLVGGVSPYVSIINEKTNCNLSHITSKDVVDSKVVEQPSFFSSNDKEYAAWKEEWTIQVCGKLVHIPITFIQVEDVPGTSYSVTMSDIVVE